MRLADVGIGRRYLTRTIAVPRRLDVIRERTRGEVRVEAIRRPPASYPVEVTWLMQDGTVRGDSRLPRFLAARELLVEVGYEEERDVRG